MHAPSETTRTRSFAIAALALALTLVITNPGSKSDRLTVSALLLG